MPYGRLDIFWPDGSIRSFMLDGPHTSVGRSSGSTLALDNTTISRYHFSLTVAGGLVYITDLDSANGTYVDGVKLPVSEQHQLFGGEEILIGNLRMSYYYLDQTATQEIPAVDDATQRIELSLPEFGIDLHTPMHSVTPGAYLTAELSLENTGPESRRFTVEVTGLPADWVRIDRPAPLVDAGETTFVLITIKPPRRPDSRPGSYTARVRVYPQDLPAAVLETPLALQVRAFHGFGLALAHKRISGAQTFQLYVHNQGSAPLPLAVSGRDAAGALAFALPTPRVTLAPGEQLTLRGSVKPRQRAWLGGPRQRTFDLQVRSLDNAGFLAAVRGQYVEQPPLPGWSPLALLAAGAALLALVAVAALAFGGPSPAPVIAGAQLSSTLVGRGTPVSVSWQATDAAEVRLLVNGTPVFASADPADTSVRLDTSGLFGPVSVIVEAVNQGQTSAQALTVEVYEPLRLERFSAAPQQLLRALVQPLTVEWEVAGAVASSVAAPDFFTPNLLESAGTGGKFELVGIPLASFPLLLVARDAAGGTLEQTLIVTVANPSCAASRPLELRAGPDPAHQVVGTVPANVAVAVDGRDPAGRWLRVPDLGGGVAGWGQRDLFVCAGFNPDNLRVEMNLPPTPTPPPTVTPLPTLTPTPAPAATAPPPSVTPGPLPTTAG